MPGTRELASDGRWVAGVRQREDEAPTDVVVSDLGSGGSRIASWQCLHE